jgi:calcium/calmodulin-dependent protein kinase I
MWTDRLPYVSRRGRSRSEELSSESRLNSVPKRCGKSSRGSECSTATTSSSRSSIENVVRRSTGGSELHKNQRVGLSPDGVETVAPTEPSYLHMQYRLGAVLGVGTFSIVRSATDRKTGEHFACKILTLPRQDSGAGAEDAWSRPRLSTTRAEVVKEVRAMRAAGPHPNLLTLRECFEERGRVYMVLQHLSGGELLEALHERGSLSEGDAREVLFQLLDAVSHLHAAGVTHRDIKLENIMLSCRDDLSSIKLCDFGVSHVLDGQTTGTARMSTLCGTPEYVAPELVWAADAAVRSQNLAQQSDCHRHANNQCTTTASELCYGPEVDVWSCGVVLYALLSGYPPFTADSSPSLLSKVSAGAFDFSDPVWDLISEDAKDLVSWLLTRDPALRPSAQQTLHHPWFTEDVCTCAPTAVQTRVCGDVPQSSPLKLPYLAVRVPA